MERDPKLAQGPIRKKGVFPGWIIALSNNYTSKYFL
jgi:hypothetical protein